MRPARCIAPSECWNRLCSAAGNTQRADWSWGTRRNRCTHEVSMRSCSGASPRIAPGRVYRMYWWMGSAMRPRPWYVSAAPFTASRLARPIERVPVDRGHRDDAHAVGALHRHLDQVARAPGPELEVEVLARLDGHAVDADRARAHPGHGLLRSPERRHGPRAGVLELDHTQSRVEVEPDQSRAHRAAPIPLRLDRDRVQE